MSSDEHIRIDRSELFTPDVSQRLEHDKELKRRSLPEPPPLSPIRRLFMNSLFYLPAAAALGVFAVWLMLEPHISDVSRVGGEVVMIDTDPFAYPDGITVITVDETQVIVAEGVRFEAGADGQPAYATLGEIEEGDLVEVSGLAGEQDGIVALAIRPATEDHANQTGVDISGGMWALLLLFPLTATFIALGLLVSEGIASRNWARMIERGLLGSFLAMIFSGLCLIPAAIVMFVGQMFLQPSEEQLITTIADISSTRFLVYTACRSMAWACVGAGLGLGMNLVRSTRPQLRNAVLGGALGGALGGMFFDPIDRFARLTMFSDSSTSRLAGLIALGLSIGIFVALVERLAREAWIRVRTGPLAGKAFVLYRTPTTIGSSPQCDIYLFKDAEIDPSHAAIHRVGSTFEVEDTGSRMGTRVAGQRIRRRRLSSGDQIIIGGTVLEFEERQKRTPPA
jgi:hypothetical protein